MAKISIIVPVYNVEKYIEKCIQSILEQTFLDFELILVDDGSTDKSGYICDEYAAKDSRIKVIHKQNGGLSSARNEGLNICQGDYIGFVDSDDHIHRDMYEILYFNIKKYECEIAICEECIVKEYETVENEAYDNEDIELLNNIQALNYSYNIKNIFIHSCNKLYKKNIFEDIRFPNGRIYEDQFITPKLLYSAEKIIYVKSKLYYYVQRDGSIINSKFSLKKLDKVYALECNMKFLREINQKNISNKAQKLYVDTLLWSDYIARKDLGVNKELDVLRLSIKSNLLSIIKNPLITYKQKVLLVIYSINQKMYYKITNDFKK